jgi:glycosyltransferase involved in cell wall biosynthesis
MDAAQASHEVDIRRQVSPVSGRVAASGKLFSRNGDTFYLKGVTYGTFAPDANGDQFPSRQQTAQDFKAIAASGFNTVRTYTAPPGWLFDEALANNLQILAGLPWEQHVAFLDDRALASDIRTRVRKHVESCARHPAILGFTIGNEIPSSIVRWYGRETIAGFLRELFDIAKNADPEALATYVNFPTTAYLELPFLDFCSFNVYLEESAKLAAYLKRLHNLSHDLPLVMAELGLDSRRNGEDKQAKSLDWQIRTAFHEGCAGAFAYAWTDEWYRGGDHIKDWDFGLTDRQRKPKKALDAVRSAMGQMPFGEPQEWPSISVVVCSYNGSATIRDTLDHLSRIDYPNYEVIVVNDGSKDETPRIAAEYNVRLISTENQGLGQARNEGLAAAKGEILVYTDDDAYPPSPWLRYLGRAFRETDHACIGGPNLCPAEDGWTGQCVADSPGGPLCVLLTDDIAEHVPGCNMAFRKDRLAAIGGFDPIYRTAGDDVDVCWRLQDRGWTIGYVAAAMVWHHRRATVKRYWRQQIGYGKAEALLERKWPGRFSTLGHISWPGTIYGRGLSLPLVKPKPRVYQGQWGLAPYQGVYQGPPNSLLSLAQTPEWLLPTAFFFLIGVLGLLYRPFFWSFVPGCVMLAVFIIQAWNGARAAKILIRARLLTPAERARSLRLVFLMHLMQPVARLWGRLKHGLSPWRLRSRFPKVKPAPLQKLWSETWHPPEFWLSAIEAELAHFSAIIARGGAYEAWDLKVSGGLFAKIYLFMTIEDHARGKQYLRFRKSFVPGKVAVLIGGAAMLLVLLGGWQGSWPGVAVGVGVLFWAIFQTLSEKRLATCQIDAALSKLNNNR